MARDPLLPGPPPAHGDFPPAGLKAERASMFTPALRVPTRTLYVFFGSTPWSLTPMR